MNGFAGDCDLAFKYGWIGYHHPVFAPSKAANMPNTAASFWLPAAKGAIYHTFSAIESYCCLWYAEVMFIYVKKFLKL